MGEAEAFRGAKVALFVGDGLAVILRDELPGLPWAGYWDFPGGGREAGETPFACLKRECEEELGLSLKAEDIRWERAFETTEGVNWFFLARLPEKAADHVVFGDEGQEWRLMSVAAYLSHSRAIPMFQHRLQIALANEEA